MSMQCRELFQELSVEIIPPYMIASKVNMLMCGEKKNTIWSIFVFLMTFINFADKFVNTL